MNIDDLREYAKNKNVQAFLNAIRLGEGTNDMTGYYRLVGGGNFVNFDKHPNRRIFVPRYGVFSTASGAYQIINATWIGLVDQYGFVDFSPANQDLAAIGLIVEAHAIGDVIAGHLADAIQKCSIEWASLPGSKAGQRIEQYANVEKAFINAGGTLA